MKKITLLLTITFAIISCNCQKNTIAQSNINSDAISINQNHQMPIIEYIANTRGYYQKIIIQDQKIAISTVRDQEKMPEATSISETDWKFLLAEFQKINLNGLVDLKAPTEKRFYDGAAMANLKISYQDKEYTSATFDNGFPPAEIEVFVNKITSLAKK